MSQILIVEDEPDLAGTLAYNLERESWSTSTAGSGERALEILEAGGIDLVILDLMLPGLSGIEVCRRLRQSETTRRIPVLMLTARGEEIDRVVGFEVGADDYVVKPFSIRELLWRVRALLRRAEPSAAPADRVHFGLLELEPAAHRALVAGAEVRLTALEFRLLTTLLGRRGRVQTRETLLADVWGIRADITTRTVDTHVKRLREKMGAAGAYIETLRGVGYRFRARPDEEPA